MKNANYLFIVLLTILLAGCKKDDSDDFIWNKDSLKQTSWKGGLELRYGERIVEGGSIGILFATDKRGSYELKYQKGDAPTCEDFLYEIDNDLLTILNNENGWAPDLKGDWIVVEKSKDKLVLVRGINNEESGTITLKLTRNY